MTLINAFRNLTLFVAVAALPLAACSDDVATSDASVGDALIHDTSAGDHAAKDAQADVVVADSVAIQEASAEDLDHADQRLSDVAVHDGATGDTSHIEACALPAQAEVTGVATIVACVNAAAKVDQCQAATFCGAGWHLCTASEYKAHFKAGPLPSSVSANVWLAGCIRDGAAATAPKDNVCSQCVSTKGSSIPIAKGCSTGNTVMSSHLYVGVRTSMSCLHLGGITDGTTSAYWSPWFPEKTLPGALCCK